MTFVLMQNTSLPKYRPLSSTPKAAYLPVTSYIFLTSETRLLVNLSTNCFYCFFLQAVVRRDVCGQTLETCLQMDIYAYHYARRASAYKWFFNVFVYNHYPYKKEKNVPCCPSCLWYYKNNKNSLGFRLLCNHACIDITCQYERCSFVT